MKPHEEFNIEQYLRFPEELTEREIWDIEFLLKTNFQARQYAGWLTDYYRELDLLSRPSFIDLTPIAGSLKPPGTMVLAAMTSSPFTNAVTTKATFGSERDHTLLRVLEKADDKTLQFHVISRFLHQEDRVVIGFQESGIELITGSGGSLLDIEYSRLEDVKWDSGTVWMKLPVQIWRYDPDKPEAFTEELSISFENDSAMLRIFDEKVSRVLVEQGSSSVIYHITDTHLLIPAVHTEPITLFLYH